MTRAALADRVRLERQGLSVETAPTWDDTEQTWEQPDDWEPDVGDNAGNVITDWFPVGNTLRCEIRELGGDEVVQAGKLEGRGTCVVIVRSSRVTRSITTDDRLIDLATNRVLNVRHAPPPGRGQYIGITCEYGVAV